MISAGSEPQSGTVAHVDLTDTHHVTSAQTEIPIPKHWTLRTVVSNVSPVTRLSFHCSVCRHRSHSPHAVNSSFVVNNHKPHHVTPAVAALPTTASILSLVSPSSSMISAGSESQSDTVAQSCILFFPTCLPASTAHTLSHSLVYNSSFVVNNQKSHHVTPAVAALPTTASIVLLISPSPSMISAGSESQSDTVVYVDLSSIHSLPICPLAPVSTAHYHSHSLGYNYSFVVNNYN